VEADPGRVSAWRRLLAVAVAVPALAGCSGADALQAEQLLQQANTAQSSVTSESISAHLTFDASGRQVRLSMTGGGYLKGARAGDMVLDLRVDAPVSLPFGSIRVAKVGGATWLEIDGKRVDLPAGALDSPTETNLLGAFDVTRYVKDVEVHGNQVLDGKSVTKITGVLDTASLVQALAALDGAGSAAGLPNLGGRVGDTRVVVWVDDTTHLLVAALADFSLHEGGQVMHMHLDLVVTGVDEPVALPA